jgi:hypothetical protein
MSVNNYKIIYKKSQRFLKCFKHSAIIMRYNNETARKARLNNNHVLRYKN